MHETITSYVGLDIHKDSVAIAIAPAGRGAPQFIGTTTSNLAQVCKVLTRQKCVPSTTLAPGQQPQETPIELLASQHEGNRTY